MHEWEELEGRDLPSDSELGEWKRARNEFLLCLPCSAEQTGAWNQKSLEDKLKSILARHGY